jgi:organic radical activating enzyme
MSQGGIEITTVSRCQNMCSYCPQKLLAQQYGPKEYMTLETFVTCLNKIPKDVDILFAGFAEPFLNPNATEMIKIATNNGYVVKLYTTLVNITKEDIDALKGLDIEIVLHLPDNDGDMKVVVDDVYIDNLKKLIDELPYHNAHAYKSLHHKLQNFTICNIAPEKALHSRGNNNDFATNDRLTGEIYCDVIKRHHRNKYNHNVLLPNGDVVLCCMDYGLQHKLGNLLHCSYEELFTSEAYQQIMRGLNDDTINILCRTCHEARKK